ncbi:hypothetical protein C8Q74DRAFT_1390821 [Fomes fomentarius]|nr:hypothetical protein C8Q74DRAFT_1390821 [Fomes fomentarius]
MSDNLSYSASEIIATENTLQVGDQIAAAMTALIAYEYIITFDLEVELFWRQKTSMSTILFLVNRYWEINYIALLWTSSSVFKLYESRAKQLFSNLLCSCVVWFYLCQTTQNAGYFPWAVFSALRAFALSSRSWSLAIAVFLLSIAPMVINYVANIGYLTPTYDPTYGCKTIPHLSATTVTHGYYFQSLSDFIRHTSHWHHMGCNI